MWSLPKDFIGNLALNEKIFQAIDFVRLMKIRMKCSNIIEAAVKYLKEGISKLIRYICEKSLIIDIHFKLVSLENMSVIKEISSLNPWTISWSNICDYFKPEEFHLIARQCSGKDTVHFAYSMNWPYRVFGASVLDYRFNTKKGGELLDELIKGTSRGIETFYEMYDCKALFNFPPIIDARNLADFALFLRFKDLWTDYFFSKDISGIEDINRQVQITKTLYNIFSRTASTIFFVFDYDPRSSFIEYFN